MSIDDVTDLTPRIRYTASAAQTVFAYPFPIFDDADLVILVDDVAQTLTTDYTVDGAGDDLGGDVTLGSAMSGGEIVTIYRDTVIERTADFQQNGPIASVTTNDELDKLYIIAQELKAKIGRAIRFPFTAAQTSDGAELTPISNWFNKFLYIGATGLLEAAATISGVVALTRTVIGQLLYPQTSTELAAGFTPVNIYIPSAPLDIRRAGGIDDGATDNSAALAACISVLAQRGGGKILVPIDIGSGYKFATGVSASNMTLELVGEGYKSALFTSNDITILTMTNCPSSYIGHLRFQGKGALATLPGLLVDSSPNTTQENILISLFDKGYLSRNISFSVSHNQCQYFSNNTMNADLQANSNAHTFNNCTLGGGPVLYGVRVYDSNSPVFNGGDFEGCKICAVDLDFSVANKMSALFIGTHFEENGPTGGFHLGDIRIGNTAAVSGVTLNGCLFSPGANTTYGINAIRGDALNVIGGRLLAGYGSVAFENIGAAFGSYDIRGMGGYSTPELSATTPDPGNGGTVATKGTRASRVTPSGNETGWILQAGTFNGQTCTVLNQGGGSGTFAAYATSHVARGVSVVIPATGSQLFTWDSSAAAWY